MHLELHTSGPLSEENTMKEDRKLVTALSRGLDLLRCFSPSRQVLSATDIRGVSA
jgi:hypothetical protein